MTIASQIAIPVAAGNSGFSFDSPGQPQFHMLRIHLDNLFQSLWEQIRDVEHAGVRPAHVLLGEDFFVHFLRESSLRKEDMEYINFRVPPDYRAPVQPDTFQAVFCGLTVHLIPWMRGVVVVPRLDAIITPGQGAQAAINNWTVAVNGHLAAIAAGTIPQREPVETAEVSAMLRRFRDAFTEWMERPSGKPFLKDERWWRRTGGGE